jgi:ubiquinone/menaquinone biosynthesis C-methylase UbiE
MEYCPLGAAVSLEPGTLWIQEAVMPDVYNTIATADTNLVQRIATALEVRAADRQQQHMLESYLNEIQFPPAARVLEVGCGTGPVARRLATWPNVAEVIGLDPSAIFIAKARELSAQHANLSFREGLAHPLPFSDAEVDVVVFHTTLCHLSEPREALGEAFRVLRPGGWLAIYDGDYASTTFGTGVLDPLQICAESFRANFVHDSWLARRTPMLAQAAGFRLVSYRTHGYTEAASPDYMLTIVDRGADALASTGQIGPGLAEALKAEARRRVPVHEFFGHINYTSLIAAKPA